MKKKIIIISVLVILISGIFLYTKINNSEKHFKVTFFDIGQGDAALIQFNNGQKMLVDCGPDKKILAKLGQALPFYDRTIDFVLATHPDLDHYGGCVDVLKNYTVKEIITNGRKKENDPYWQEWDKTIEDEPGATIKVMSEPEVWTVGSSTLQFISPDPSLPLEVAAADSNNYSIVFKLQNANESFLFTGDMEMPLENALINKYCPNTSTPPCPALQSDILKVGHHGSDTGSGELFLNLVHPQIATISVGKNNHYGHPSLRVIRKLERVGAQIIRTDQVGDIVQY